MDNATQMIIALAICNAVSISLFVWASREIGKLQRKIIDDHIARIEDSNERFRLKHSGTDANIAALKTKIYYRINGLKRVK